MSKYKYGRSYTVGETLGKLLVERFLQVEKVENYDLMTVVPLDPIRLGQRGFNQCDLIARQFSSSLDIPYEPDIVRRKIALEHQAGKSKGAREKLDCGFFVSQEGMRILVGVRRLLILDDVMTTGSTLNGMARVIKVCSPSVKVYSVCLFRGKAKYGIVK